MYSDRFITLVSLKLCECMLMIAYIYVCMNTVLLLVFGALVLYVLLEFCIVVSVVLERFLDLFLFCLIHIYARQKCYKINFLFCIKIASFLVLVENKPEFIFSVCFVLVYTSFNFR